MRISQEKVRAFHDKHGYANPDKPTIIDSAAVQVRYGLIGEELEEYRCAGLKGDLVEVADALADLLYTVLGTAVVHGIDLQPIFEVVHKSNMSKTSLDPVTKKGGKGSGYQAPIEDISALLLIQTTGLNAVGVNLPAK